MAEPFGAGRPKCFDLIFAQTDKKEDYKRRCLFRCCCCCCWSLLPLADSYSFICIGPCDDRDSELFDSVWIFRLGGVITIWCATQATPEEHAGETKTRVDAILILFQQRRLIKIRILSSDDIKVWVEPVLIFYIFGDLKRSAR